MTFQNKCFNFCVGDYIFEFFNLRNQNLNFNTVMVLAVEITQDASFKDFGLSDIDNFAFLVIIYITPRKRRQKFKSLFKLLIDLIIL